MTRMTRSARPLALCTCALLLAATPAVAQSTGYVQRLGVMDGSGKMVYRYYDDKGQRIHYDPATGKAAPRDMSASQVKGMIGQVNDNIVRVNQRVEEYKQRLARFENRVAQFKTGGRQLEEDRRLIQDAIERLKRMERDAENLSILGSAGSAAWADSMNRKIDARNAAKRYREKVDGVIANFNNLVRDRNRESAALAEESKALNDWRNSLITAQQELAAERQTLSQALSRTLNNAGLGDHRPANER